MIFTQRFKLVVAHIMAAMLLFSSFPVRSDDAQDAEDLVMLGRVIDNLLQHDLVFLENDQLHRALNDVLRSVTTPNDQLSTNYEVQVLNSLLPNAFASPSGSIYVTTGLLDTLENSDELAFIFAHQIAHVETLGSWDEFARVRSERAKIMWATYIAMGVITVATVGAMASAAGALSSAGVSAAQAAGNAPLLTVGGVSAALTQIQNSRVRFAKSGILTEPNYYPVFGPALFAALNMGIYDGSGGEEETEYNQIAMDLLANAGIDIHDVDFYANRIGASAKWLRTHMTAYTSQQIAYGDEESPENSE